MVQGGGESVGGIELRCSQKVASRSSGVLEYCNEE
jgi:hypothetical protein